ncbi:MAG: hypothetical protein FWD48_02285 [Oscillospiraceae bacterium]|nr:hypothetical protein [Oscillospiraceae bacterium]
MKHLFIINPGAEKVKGRVAEITDEIVSFFIENPQHSYDIHVTRWNRDATGFVRRYVTEAETPVRVHCFGGSGTLFEITNGVVGVKNTEVSVAMYPMGTSGELLFYFGTENLHLFRSIKNQVEAGTTPLDTFRVGNIHGISHSLIGMEARSSRESTRLIESTLLPANFCYVFPAIVEVLSGRACTQKYTVEVDGVVVSGDCKYASVNIFNGPCYGKNMFPAIDAHPNDGKLDVYLLCNMPPFKMLATVSPYTKGKYRKIPERIKHFSGKKIKVSSDEVMCVSLDGEIFYETEIEYEIVPASVNFVLPAGIDIKKLPRIYNHPEEGLIGDK